MNEATIDDTLDAVKTQLAEFVTVWGDHRKRIDFPDDWNGGSWATKSRAERELRKHLDDERPRNARWLTLGEHAVASAWTADNPLTKYEAAVRAAAFFLAWAVTIRERSYPKT